MVIPHPDKSFIIVNCGIITISDSRTFDDDNSGKLIKNKLLEIGHNITFYQIIKDDYDGIKTLLNSLILKENIDILILTGGTGISLRDNTFEVVDSLLDKNIPGFGEIFRHLSYGEIGSRAMVSRAIAGICKRKIIFALPGSSNAVELAMDKLILPELNHLITQLEIRNN
ncbi:MogA/MoaB family molybdenum cofactor biosynthesis protein [Cyanobacterium stanieri LEGE 03274]|uniref:Molybdenum cofactor biosynthesis protein B n=1 Tax=Cyanobacterium stanieri LEGE 03274 TaxID=1828756 RepID=A0ABR9V6J6_9CHRO|nr:MogA/MoaB family molybdenum cofactor biosynthesis protein [Cyanobacterium stanieri]MBE9223126.1 MogA/MoaB family molybdenum cofactor biosynthesis protein [Cyanobacterium stanieri LEGE 03274]